MPRTGATHYRRPLHWSRPLVGVLAAVLFTLGGCGTPEVVKLRARVAELEDTLVQRDQTIAAKTAAETEWQQQINEARGIQPGDLTKIFYPAQLVIDSLSGGYDSDKQPGDDGVTVYLKPVDQYGDVIKVAGDLTIQLYDLAADPRDNFIGEYKVSADQIGKLWHGRLLTSHYTIKCPFPADRRPQHSELTIRAVFVDYLTRRVVAAQATCKVKLPQP